MFWKRGVTERGFGVVAANFQLLLLQFWLLCCVLLGFLVGGAVKQRFVSCGDLALYVDVYKGLEISAWEP